MGAPGLGFIAGSPVFIPRGSYAQISFPSRPTLGWGDSELGMLHGGDPAGPGPVDVLWVGPGQALY